MGKYLPRYLVTSLSLAVIGIGSVLLWFGLKPLPTQVPPVSSPIATASARFAQRAALGIEGERVLVTKVVDGDTIQIDSGQTIRFIGIDTPETVDPRKSVQCFGKEASNEAKSLLSGKVVYLQKDVSEVDKYKRLLRYVYLPLEDGSLLFVNDYLVREGFARVLTYPPDVKFNEQFRQAEQEAKDNLKGFWGKC